jgi:drug/metabolite transporter (DMT)-like permease
VVAIWSLLLLGVRLTLAQAFGVLLSLCGVLVILLHGDLTTLSKIDFNKGDLIFIVALVIFALYSVLSLKRPQMHPLSFAAFTFGAGAACLIPLFIWELVARPPMAFNTANLLTLAYVALFPSTLAYLCFNRGVQLIGANRADVLSRGAGVRHCDVDRLPRRASAGVPVHRLRAGVDRRIRGVAEAAKRVEPVLRTGSTFLF